ncbi:MAG: NAD-dependent epimerase/dehydratase family protein [Planctomycetota bacterium]
MTQPGPCYIVTGGCGFIGSNVAATLEGLDGTCHVLVIDSFRSGTFQTLVDSCTRITGEPFRGEVLPESVESLDWPSIFVERRPAAVFHLGAITDTTIDDESDMIRQNAGDSWRLLLETAADAEVPLVYASSAATYGTPPETNERVAFAEASAGRPNNVYGFSKWMMESAHRRLSAERVAAGEPQPWVIGLRYFNVFGPGESGKAGMASMAFQLARQLFDGDRPRLFADGAQTRDQVPVQDIVGLTLAAAGLGERIDPRPGVYNAGSGVPTTFEEVAEAVRRGMGVSGTDRPTEYFEMPAHIARFYQSFTLADMSAAKAGLGFEPRHPPQEAIATYAAMLAKEWASSER